MPVRVRVRDPSPKSPVIPIACVGPGACPKDAAGARTRVWRAAIELEFELELEKRSAVPVRRSYFFPFSGFRCWSIQSIQRR